MLLLLAILLSKAASISVQAAQQIKPEPMPMLPLSIPPTIPKNAMKHTREMEIFTILTIARQVKNATREQMNSIKPLPRFILGSARLESFFCELVLV